jgi:hypothetical protein
MPLLGRSRIAAGNRSATARLSMCLSPEPRSADCRSVDGNLAQEPVGLRKIRSNLEEGMPPPTGALAEPADGGKEMFERRR